MNSAFKLEMEGERDGTVEERKYTTKRERERNKWRNAFKFCTHSQSSPVRSLSPHFRLFYVTRSLEFELRRRQ